MTETEAISEAELERLGRAYQSHVRHLCAWIEELEETQAMLTTRLALRDGRILALQAEVLDLHMRAAAREGGRA